MKLYLRPCVLILLSATELPAAFTKSANEQIFDRFVVRYVNLLLALVHNATRLAVGNATKLTDF
jgi:hypothetical protein